MFNMVTLTTPLIFNFVILGYEFSDLKYSVGPETSGIFQIVTHVSPDFVVTPVSIVSFANDVTFPVIVSFI